LGSNALRKSVAHAAKARNVRIPRGRKGNVPHRALMTTVSRLQSAVVQQARGTTAKTTSLHSSTSLGRNFP
jgi:hypothetical protein